MEFTPRAVRVPADNCPGCRSEKTAALMARFDPPGMHVTYQCWACARSWTVAWGMEMVA